MADDITAQVKALAKAVAFLLDRAQAEIEAQRDSYAWLEGRARGYKHDPNPEILLARVKQMRADIVE